MSKKAKKKIINAEMRLQKKDVVMRKSRTHKLPVILLLCGLVLAAAGTWLYRSAPNSDDAAILPAAEDEHESEFVSYDLALFADGRARHFIFQKDGGKTIRYFVVKSSDGIIRAAFDACDVCWPAGKGYAQDGDQMVCRNCGRRFDSIRINEVKGGCNPAPLARKVDGDQLIIQKSHILEGLKYFNFSRKV